MTFLNKNVGLTNDVLVSDETKNPVESVVESNSSKRKSAGSVSTKDTWEHFERFLNEANFHGGFEEGDIEKVFAAMEENYEAWVNGFAPVAVGVDVPAAVREYSRTLSNMRPDISLFVSRTAFCSDLRGVLGLVKAACWIIQTAKDASVTTYLKEHLGGQCWEIMKIDWNK